MEQISKLIEDISNELIVRKKGNKSDFRFWSTKHLQELFSELKRTMEALEFLQSEKSS